MPVLRVNAGPIDLPSSPRDVRFVPWDIKIGMADEEGGFAIPTLIAEIFFIGLTFSELHSAHEICREKFLVAH